MVPQNLSLALMCALSVWTTAAACGDGQRLVDGRCCELCPPGTYMEGFCSQKVCLPCKKGLFSHKYNLFDTCEECRSCQQDVSVKCTPTTNTNCSCRSGFLCSNNICSKCEENKCVIGEKLNRTDKTLDDGLIKYLYTCEPQLDVSPETQREGMDSNRLTLCIAIVFLSLTFVVSVFYGCMKNRGKHVAYNPDEFFGVSTNASEFHLSKEESGLEFIMQEESKTSNSLSLQCL
ncbi:tumor necrosis factor receptor superfamily member 6-like [Gasterosteus aculeatus]